MHAVPVMVVIPANLGVSTHLSTASSQLETAHAVAQLRGNRAAHSRCERGEAYLSRQHSPKPPFYVECITMPCERSTAPKPAFFYLPSHLPTPCQMLVVVTISEAFVPKPVLVTWCHISRFHATTGTISPLDLHRRSQMMFAPACRVLQFFPSLDLPSGPLLLTLLVYASREGVLILQRDKVDSQDPARQQDARRLAV